MAVCYVEVFLLQNACTDAALLWLAASWRGGRIYPFRIALGALLGAVFALVAALGGGFLRSVLSQGLVSVGMVYAGIGGLTRAEALKSAGALWIFALVLGGAVSAGVSMPVAGVVTGFAGMALVRRKNTLPPPRVTLTVRKGEISRTLEAIVDTGNRVLDPFLNIPAVFVPEGLFDIPLGRSLYIRTAAGIREVPCFVPDACVIDGNPVAAVVAVPPRRLLDCALVPRALCAERTAS